MAVGGAAYLVSKAIKSARVVGFADLGMEAIYEFEVQDMPVTVAVDASGESVHRLGPKLWQARIGKIPVVLELAGADCSRVRLGVGRHGRGGRRC
jgi:fumarate hydratase class I